MTMQIDWWTFGLQTINFLVLVWLLWRFLYRPVRAVLERRKELAEQAFAEADKAKAEAEAARQRYEESRAALAQERQDMLKKVHDELEGERRKLLDKAGAEADKMLEAARATISEERKAALADIREQVAGLATELAADLMRKTGPGASGAEALERLERQLEAMSPAERERLGRELKKDGAALTVVTSAPLAAEQQGEWAARLARSLGQEAKTDFATDPGLLGGAELRFPHAVLKLTGRDQLARARNLLGGNDDAS